MTKIELQKKALSLGLPKTLTVLSAMMGYNSTHLSVAYSSGKITDKTKKRIEEFFIEQEIKKLYIPTVKDSYTYKVEGKYTSTDREVGNFIYQIEHFIESNDAEEEHSQEIYNYAVIAISVAFRFECDRISDLKITRMDTEQEKEELLRILKFI